MDNMIKERIKEIQEAASNIFAATDSELVQSLANYIRNELTMLDTDITTNSAEAFKVVMDAVSRYSHEGRLLWDVMTGLRSHDHGSNTLKEYTAARLRYIVGLHADSELAYARSERLSIDEIRDRNNLLAANGQSILGTRIESHFGCHFIEAMRAAKELGFDVPEDELDFELGLGGE